MPFVRPVMTSGDDRPSVNAPPGLAVARKLVMGEPPLLLAMNEIVPCVGPGVAVTLIGATGTVTGVAALLAAEAGPVPTAFVAVTVNVYG